MTSILATWTCKMDYKSSIHLLGLFVYITCQLSFNLPTACCKPSLTLHLTNYSETFHDFNQTRSHYFLRMDRNGAQAKLHNQVESLAETSQQNSTSEIANALSQFPSVSVNVSSSTSRRHRRQETCMTLMWRRQLSHKVTSSMKSAACQQYQKWGEGMKKQSPWKADHQTTSWLSKLGLDAFRHHGYKGRRGRRQTLRQRKDYRVMTEEERQRFHSAIRRLKQTRLGRNNRYDVFVLLHQPATAPAAHFGPAFLGWHREMLFRFENALRELDSEVTIPYWDSTLDAYLGTQADDAITWTDAFLGTRRGQVTSGPFADFSLVIDVNGRNSLHRGVGSTLGQRAEPRLMTSEDVRLIVESGDMRNITWFVDPSFEVAHGSVHNFVSGVFADLANSASDPLFYLHHAFIDCLWEEQRQRLADYVDYQTLYPTDSQALGVGVIQPDGTMLNTPLESSHHPRAEMRPFGPLSNVDGLSTDYQRYYSCAPRPSCSPDHPSCDSPALFCDMRSWQCAVKLRNGAACSRWADYNPCYGGVCCEGVCREQCEYWTPDPPAPTARGYYPPNWNRSNPWARGFFQHFPEVPTPPFSPPQPPTHPPDYFRWHHELERLALG